MTTFGTYAQYYDLLYRDKPYAAEAAHLHDLLRAHAPGARTLLELGCGTGAHAVALAALGYEIHGVDSSETMLALAQPRATGAVHVELGDARTLRLARRFDAVISLFHVMSYQTANADLAAAFATARAHLEPGGLFVFDCWYGPAVLTDRPTVRTRTVEDDRIALTRRSAPTLHAARNVVDVEFRIALRDKPTGETRELHELHSMRYLFSPELELLLAGADLALVYSGEWLTGRALDDTTWNACFAARAM